MKLTRNKLFFGILAFIAAADLLVLLDVHFFNLRAIFSSLFLLIIPGLLIILVIGINKTGFMENIFLIIGLSISFLLFAGLLFNWLFYFIGVKEPLSLVPLAIGFNILLLTLWVIAFFRNRDLFTEVKPPGLGRVSNIFLLVPIVFPILSVLGAGVLNNNGPNYLTLVMLGGIAVYVVLAVLFRKKTNSLIYPWVIWMLGAALLLMYSLRSRYILGYDIHQEYLMFLVTKENLHWTMASFRGSAYNACLSITILPAVFSSFLDINDEYIFKLVIQVVFSVVPVVIYFLLKRFFKKGIVAFLSVFFFISQFQFMQQMPSLIRQEVSVLFFVLLLFIIFEDRFKNNVKNILLLIFCFSMIVSHYSTNYIALILFSFVYIVWLFFRKTANIGFFSRIYRKLNLKDNKKLSIKKIKLNGIIVLILIIFSFLWTFQLTQSSGNIINAVRNTAGNIGKIFTNELRSEQAQIALGGSTRIHTQQDVLQYKNEVTQDFITNKSWIGFYDPQDYSDYRIEARYSKAIPPPSAVIEDISKYVKTIINRILQFLILAGILYLIFFEFKRLEISAEYIIMALGSLFLLGVILFIPYISIAYNFERLFQQTLIILAPTPIIVTLAIFRFVKNKNRVYVPLAVLLVLFFLFFSGFMTQFVGGKPGVNLNNFGEEYNRFYTHRSEVHSLEWLSQEFDRDYEIYMEKYARLKASYFLDLYEKSAIPYILPSIMGRDSYVYSSYPNTTEQIVGVSYRNGFLEYNYPAGFLNENKNKIYDNGGSEIFK